MRHAAVAAIVLGLLACKSSDKSGSEGTAKATATAASAAAPGSAASGEDACAAYQKALEACVAKAPEASKAALQKTLETQRDAFAHAPPVQRAQMQDGCRTGMATLKQNPDCP